MGWVQDQFKKQTENPDKAFSKEMGGQSSAEGTPEGKAWMLLQRGFAHDVEEFQRLGGHCTLERISDLQCRITNTSASVGVNRHGRSASAHGGVQVRVS